MRVKYDRNLAMLAFLAAIVIVLATSFFITPLTISDSDPSTYVIVPLLMLPLFGLFTIKTNPIPKISGKDIAIGSALFAAYIISTLASRFELSFLFISYRVDLLLFPMVIAALATLTFGLENVPKFKGMMLYSLLASPAVLLPVLKLYSAFTVLNTQIVFSAIRPFVSGASYTAPETINANGYNIGIGQACVSIGIFVALALFIIPLAYLYNGKIGRKILWVSSAVVLLFLLNISRMLGVTYVLLTYGPSATVAFLHEFIGVFLFYIVIIAMMLAAGRYGLDLKRKDDIKKRRNDHGVAISKYVGLAFMVAFLFALAYVYATISYSTALSLSPLPLSNRVIFNFSNAEVARQVGALIEGKNFSSVTIASTDGRYALFSLSNKTINSTKPLVLVVTAPNPTITANLKKNNTLLGELQFLSSNGIEETILDVRSNNTEFLTYNTDMPLLFPNISSTVASIYVIMQSSMLHSMACNSYYGTFDNAFSNIAGALLYNATIRQHMAEALCISHRLVWSNATV